MRARSARSDEGPASAGPSRLPGRGGPDSVSARPAAVLGISTVVLVATIVAVLAETLRVLFPLLYDFAEEIGFVSAAGIIPLIFCTPFAVPLLLVSLGPRVCLAGAVAALFGSRMAVQIGSPTLPLAAVGAMAGFAALAVVVLVHGRYPLMSDADAPEPGSRGAPHPLSGETVVGGVLTGLLLDGAFRMAFATWDPAWQAGVWPWVAVSTVVGLGVCALTAVLRRVGPARPPRDLQAVPATRAIAALGPFLALEVLVLGSPAFVASSARLNLEPASGVVFFALATGFASLAAVGHLRAARSDLVRQVSRSMPILAGLLLAGVMGTLTGAHGLTGAPAVAGVVAGQGLAVGLLACAFHAGHRSAARRWSGALRAGAGAGLASVLFVAVLLPYQLHYELPLPFSNRLLPAAAGLALGLFAAGGFRSAGSASADRPVLAGVATACAAAMVSVFVSAMTPAEGAEGEAPPQGVSFRLVSYNIHEAVDTRGHLDPEAIARVVEAANADVVALQEVGRGWPLSGTMDVGGWLARRLDMRLVYGPAADNQFGNAVLTELPVTRVARGRLPQGEGSMVRGYVMAEVQVGGRDGRGVQIWTTHLQHHDDTTSTRIAEIAGLIDAWGGTSPAIITGDMNARPGAAEMRVWFGRTDLRSAQDVTGHAGEPTCCWPSVDHRIDWILGTPELRFSDFVIRRTQASDHLPQAVTVTLRGR